MALPRGWFREIWTWLRVIKADNPLAQQGCLLQRCRNNLHFATWRYTREGRTAPRILKILDMNVQIHVPAVLFPETEPQYSLEKKKEMRTNIHCATEHDSCWARSHYWLRNGFTLNLILKVCIKCLAHTLIFCWYVSSMLIPTLRGIHKTKFTFSKQLVVSEIYRQRIPMMGNWGYISTNS